MLRRNSLLAVTVVARSLLDCMWLPCWDLRYCASVRILPICLQAAVPNLMVLGIVVPTSRACNVNNYFSPVLIAIIFLAIGFMNLSEDMMLIPSRALLNDKLPSYQLEQGNAFFGLMQALGGVIGLGITMLPLEDMYPLSLLGTHLRACLFVAILMAILTGLISASVKEDPLTQDEQEDLEEEEKTPHASISPLSQAQPPVDGGQSNARKASLSKSPITSLSILRASNNSGAKQPLLPTAPSQRAPASYGSMDHASKPLDPLASDGEVEEDVAGNGETEEPGVHVLPSNALSDAAPKADASEAEEMAESEGFFTALFNSVKALPARFVRLWLLQFFWWAAVLNLSLWW